jgi:hypothetical protein
VSAAGRFVAALAVGLLAGVPFLGGLYVEAVVVAWVTGWPTGTVWAVQAVPLAVLGGVAVVVHAIGVGVDGWDG